jgi:hypothetical protein
LLHTLIQCSVASYEHTYPLYSYLSRKQKLGDSTRKKGKKGRRVRKGEGVCIIEMGKKKIVRS